MNKYTVKLADGAMLDVEAKYFRIDDGYLIFRTGDDSDAPFVAAVVPGQWVYVEEAGLGEPATEVKK